MGLDVDIRCSNPRALGSAKVTWCHSVKLVVLMAAVALYSGCRGPERSTYTHNIVNSRHLHNSGKLNEMAIF